MSETIVKKQILVDVGVHSKLRKRCNATYPTIRRALSEQYNEDSKKQYEIRKAALKEFGGVEKDK